MDERVALRRTAERLIAGMPIEDPLDLAPFVGHGDYKLQRSALALLTLGKGDQPNQRKLEALAKGLAHKAPALRAELPKAIASHPGHQAVALLVGLIDRFPTTIGLWEILSRRSPMVAVARFCQLSDRDLYEVRAFYRDSAFSKALRESSSGQFVSRLVALLPENNHVSVLIERIGDAAFPVLLAAYKAEPHRYETFLELLAKCGGEASIGDLIQANIGRNSIHPRTQGCPAVKPVKASPGPDHGLLYSVIGIPTRAQHSIAVAG